MKFRLSTMILVVTIVVLGVGLVKERYDDQLRDNRTEQLLNGTVRAIHADRTIKLADYYFDNPEQFTEIVREELVWTVYWLWNNQTDVDELFADLDSTNSATLQCAAALRSLHCKSANEFLELAKEMDDFNGNEREFPEFFDTESSEFDSFTKFIGDSIIENIKPPE